MPATVFDSRPNSVVVFVASSLSPENLHDEESFGPPAVR